MPILLRVSHILLGTRRQKHSSILVWSVTHRHKHIEICSGWRSHEICFWFQHHKPLALVTFIFFFLRKTNSKNRQRKHALLFLGINSTILPLRGYLILSVQRNCMRTSKGWASASRIVTSSSGCRRPIFTLLPAVSFWGASCPSSLISCLDF